MSMSHVYSSQIKNLYYMNTFSYGKKVTEMREKLPMETSVLTYPPVFFSKILTYFENTN